MYREEPLLPAPGLAVAGHHHCGVSPHFPDTEPGEQHGSDIPSACKVHVHRDWAALCMRAQVHSGMMMVMGSEVPLNAWMGPGQSACLPDVRANLSNLYTWQIKGWTA